MGEEYRMPVVFTEEPYTLTMYLIEMNTGMWYLELYSGVQSLIRYLTWIL